MRFPLLFLGCATLLACAEEKEFPQSPRHFQLEGGAGIIGPVLKHSPDSYWIDLGFDVLRVPASRILDTRDPLPHRVNPPPLSQETPPPPSLPVETWVPRLGGGVVEIRSRGGQGSGFLLDAEGTILTNFHVIAQDRELTVTVFAGEAQRLERIQYRNIRILALDPANDLALLRVEDKLKTPLQGLSLGSTHLMRAGEPVFAIGSPLGLDRTVTRGIVSLVDRIVGNQVFLQTTAQINPGNSGGPLFNLRGEVVGINTLKFVRTGIEGVAFAIPTETVKTFLAKRDAYAFDPRNANTGYRYLNPPRKSEAENHPEPAPDLSR